MFFSAPKLMILLACLFLLFGVPILATIMILVERFRESQKDE